MEGERKQLAAVIGLPDLPIDERDGRFRTGHARLRRTGAAAVRRVGKCRRAGRPPRASTRNQILHERARADAYPECDTGPAYQFSPYAPGNQQFWFNIQFDIPTWDRNQGNIRSAQADVLDALSNLGTVQNDLLRQAADAISRYRAARERAERIATEILPNAQPGPADW